MTVARGTAAALALCTLAAAGCGLGPGDEAGVVELTVTRDYGREKMLIADDEVTESDTVMRVLDREAEIETRYGGGFVHSIDGLSGESDGGRRFDWFFYVNGIESPVGAANYELAGGDQVWWDYRDWTEAMRVPAVVGSYPEPFVHGFQGEEWPVEIVCFMAAEVCDPVAAELAEAGAGPVRGSQAGDKQAGGDSARVLVGTWDKLWFDETAKLLALDPERSGVFARFDGRGKATLVLLDETGTEVSRERPASGLIAALRPGDAPPTWVVTGTDPAGVRAAVGAFGRAELRDHYAVALPEGGDPEPVPLP